MANATLILVLLLVVTVNGTVVWFIPDTFAPKEFLQFVVAVATFAIGMTQNAFGKYIADMWTDRRRTNEAR